MAEQDFSIIRGLMVELAHEDLALMQAANALRRARTQFEVTSQKYAAVRDVVARHLGHSPYRRGAQSQYAVDFSSGGRYRFIHMAAGDAVIDVLRESEEPLTLEQIVVTLRDGGFRQPDPRVVNAALMRTSGVERTDDGGYRYVEEELPFQ